PPAHDLPLARPPRNRGSSKPRRHLRRDRRLHHPPRQQRGPQPAPQLPRPPERSGPLTPPALRRPPPDPGPRLQGPSRTGRDEPPLRRPNRNGRAEGTPGHRPLQTDRPTLPRLADRLGSHRLHQQEAPAQHGADERIAPEVMAARAKNAFSPALRVGLPLDT